MQSTTETKAGEGTEKMNLNSQLIIQLSDYFIYPDWFIEHKENLCVIIKLQEPTLLKNENSFWLSITVKPLMKTNHCLRLECFHNNLLITPAPPPAAIKLSCVLNTDIMLEIYLSLRIHWMYTRFSADFHSEMTAPFQINKTVSSDHFAPSSCLFFFSEHWWDIMYLKPESN